MMHFACICFVSFTSSAWSALQQFCSRWQGSRPVLGIAYHCSWALIVVACVLWGSLFSICKCRSDISLPASVILGARIQLENGCCRPEIIFDDFFARPLVHTSAVDLYVCGFPCQPFSQAGTRSGFMGASTNGSGLVFFEVVRYIKKRNPRVFILENVEGLETAQNGECFLLVLRTLFDLAHYNIYWDLLNTKHHGIPHNRPRYYFVGIRRRDDRGSFSFPSTSPMLALELLLDQRLHRPMSLDLPSQRTAVENVESLCRQVRAGGSDPFEDPWVFGCDKSVGAAMYNCSPCLTRARFAGHWLSSRGRRMSLREMARLQGVPDDFPVTVSETEFRRQLGNMMSVNVLERILCSLLPAAGLRSEDVLVDRYA